VEEVSGSLRGATRGKQAAPLGANSAREAELEPRLRASPNAAAREANARASGQFAKQRRRAALPLPPQQ
jgi:hypothetical protein